MLVYARGKDHDARLVTLLVRLMVVWLVKQPVRDIPTKNIYTPFPSIAFFLKSYKFGIFS